MDKHWEQQLKEQLTQEIGQIPWDEPKSRQILNQIHGQIDHLEERRIAMRPSKKQLTVLIAAAFMAIGSISAIAAGKISYFRSSTSLNESLHTAADTEQEAARILGVAVDIPEKLSDTLVFQQSNNTDVEALDADGAVMGTYPEISAMYGDGEVTFSISKKNQWDAQADDSPCDVQETYQDVEIRGSSDLYLFLPPDAKPSEEDARLEAAGELFIGYGSSEEQRQVCHYVSWEQNGLCYSLLNFDTCDLDTLMSMAKAYIDGQ